MNMVHRNEPKGDYQREKEKEEQQKEESRSRNKEESGRIRSSGEVGIGIRDASGMPDGCMCGPRVKVKGRGA